MTREQNLPEKTSTSAAVKPLKVLACADTHGDEQLIDKLVKQAVEEDVDLVVMCGDFTMWDDNPNGLFGKFLEKGKRVVFVPGNHDSESTANFVSDFYNIVNLHGRGVKYKDVGLFGCGGADIGLNVIQDGEMIPILKKGFESISYTPKKIMVTHAHPSSSTMEKFTQIFQGSKDVRQAIDDFKPDVVLCGHVHEAKGMEEMIGSTKVINCAKTAKVFEI